MVEKGKREERSRIGYGSSYQKGERRNHGSVAEIETVLGGQIWRVKPDKKAGMANPCIWMQAGAVEFKSCNNFYDCTTCKYDLGMLRKVEQNKQISWQDAMRKRSHLERVCRHSLTNRIEKRSCAYDYQCATCDFDQFFEEVWNTKTKTIPYEMQDVKGFEIPGGYYYHEGHAWARVESGGYIRIGLDDFTQKLLGKPDALDLPLMGKELGKDKVGWGFKRGENSADVLSPVDGVIVEVNSRARENPGMAGREPYGEGWLFMVRTSDIKASVKQLMSDNDCLDWMNGEVSRLENMIEDVAGPLAADGGSLGHDIFGNLPGLGWENLTKGFLRT